MAIVKDQDIPTEDNEDALDPAIEFINQYRRTLSEGIDHPKLAAGYEIVTATKKESRPSQRSLWKYYNKPMTEAWREIFKKCLACWKTFVETDAELDDCHSAGSKHYVKPWTYHPGAILTWFNSFMKHCLDWEVSHPGTPYWKCEDLLPYPDLFTYCPGETIIFAVSNGNQPNISDPAWAEITETLTILIPDLEQETPSDIKIEFLDSDGRRACAYGTKKPQDQCCCTPPPSLGIAYTTLQMSCSEQQQLSIDQNNQGCPPYNWELTSGAGSLTPAPNGLTALYTAPLSNQNCSNNPTITLRDSCNTTAQIKLAVNCLFDPIVMRIWGATKDGTCQMMCPEPNGHCRVVAYYQDFKCSGVDSGYGKQYYYGASCNPGGQTMKMYVFTGCSWPAGQCSGEYTENAGKCYEGCTPTSLTHPYGDSQDFRTPAQKTAGCCPINPFTGLPF